MYGYAGGILRVDLSRRTLTREELGRELADDYLGGRGFCAAILYEKMRPGIDPLSPENVVVMATGPFVATGVITGTRLVIGARSPLTGTMADSDLGGYFAPELKKAGFDAVVLEGAADSPVYIYIRDGQAELRQASHLWGLEIGEATRGIREECGDGHARVLAIGPAGENLVRYACVIADRAYAAGRFGMGAVLGAKKVKGVAVSGTGTVPVRDAARLAELASRLQEEFRQNVSLQTLGKFGTWNSVTSCKTNGVMPVENFRRGRLDDSPLLETDALLELLLDKRATCPGCPVACRRVIKPDAARGITGEYGGPQYEAVASLGTVVGNRDPFVIARAHERCNALGLDVISAGVAIAFLCECAERGVLPPREPEARARWGESPVILGLLDKIAHRRGMGDILAEGVVRAARAIGGGAEDWAVHVKGLEMAMHDPRGKKGVGLSYATSHKGADHMESVHDEMFERPGQFASLGLGEAVSRVSMAGKARIVKITQDYWGTLADSLGVCKFPLVPVRPFSPDYVREFFAAVTGRRLEIPELLTVGERIFNLCRLFNLREGFAARDDVLPARMGEPLAGGGSDGQSVGQEEFARELAEYYRLRGWDAQGRPLPETRARLGLPRPAGD